MEHKESVRERIDKEVEKHVREKDNTCKQKESGKSPKVDLKEIKFGNAKVNKP